MMKFKFENKKEAPLSRDRVIQKLQNGDGFLKTSDLLSLDKDDLIFFLKKYYDAEKDQKENPRGKAISIGESQSDRYKLIANALRLKRKEESLQKEVEQVTETSTENENGEVIWDGENTRGSATQFKQDIPYEDYVVNYGNKNNEQESSTQKANLTKEDNVLEKNISIGNQDIDNAA